MPNLYQQSKNQPDYILKHKNHEGMFELYKPYTQDITLQKYPNQHTN
jgi:hypothetical protein